MGTDTLERPRAPLWTGQGLSIGVLVLVFGAAAACNELNPRFDEAADTGGSGGGSTGGTSSTGDGSSDTGDGSTSSAEGSTGDGASGGATSGTTSVSGSGGTGSGDTTSTGTHTSSTGQDSGLIEYGASIAECVGDDALDPDACEEYAGEGVPGFMAVDLESDDGKLIISYLAFPLDGGLQGKTVTAVTLGLSTTDAAWSGSDATGEVWMVESFTLQDLFSMQPAKVGATALAADQGAVGLSETVSWSLPVDTVSPDSTVYLGVFPVSSDGVYYWNTDGAIPPLLTIDYE